MPVLKFKDKDGVVKTTPGLKIVTEKTQVNPNLNIHFGQAAPEDTSKLWVKTDKYPNDIIISPKVTGHETLTQDIATLNAVCSVRTTAVQVNGVIYLFGGTSGDGTVAIFYPETGKLEKINNVTVSTGSFSSAAVINKDIYLCPEGTNKINIFHTEINSVSTISVGNNYHNRSIAAVGDRLYIFGGRSGFSGGAYTDKNVICYDTSIKAVILNNIMFPNSVYRDRLTSTTVGSKIYIFGGADFSTSYLNNIYILDTDTNKITLSNTVLPQGFERSSAVAVGTDIYLFGGISGQYTQSYTTYYTYSKNIFKYNTLNDTIEIIETQLPIETYGIGATLLGTDIYLVGGYKLSTINKFTIQSPLNINSIRIQTDTNKAPLCNLMKNPTLETGIKKVFIGNKDNYAEEINSYIYCYVPRFTWIENRQYTYNCVENSGGTSQASSINCSIGDLIIASIITRDTFTLSDGWTLISTSELNNEYVSGNGQRLSFAYKYAENTTETITVTQASSQRLYITTIALQGATGFVDNGYSYANSQSSTSISVTKPEGLTLLACSADLWGTSTPYSLWTVSDNSEIIQLGTSTQSRLGVILDQNPEISELNIVPGGTSSPIVVGSLTITGMDKFYDVEEWSGGEMWKLL